MDAERSLRHPSVSSYRARSKRQRSLARLRSLSSINGLLVAVALCWLSWPTPAEAQPACAHDLCEVGGLLSEVCDTCVDDICSGPLGDIYCCTVEWDDNCVDQVLTVCGDVSCEQICTHSPCEQGDALDSTCNSCTALVCFLDPACCTDDGDPLTDDWDASCVLRVQQECGYQCEPGANICSEALPILPGKIFGTLLGASNDGCESGNNSCRAADVWYTYTQGAVAQDMVLSTCTTQRSFGIDTVISVHEGCPGKSNNEIDSNDDHFLGLVPQACVGSASPINLDSALPLANSTEILPGQTVVIRVAHHNESVRNNFELRLLPEPEAWLALVAGAGALAALRRRRARG